MKSLNFLIILLTVNAIIAGATAFAVVKLAEPSAEDLIAEFYETENAVHVSPHSLRKRIDTNASDFILVDLRSAQEYEKAHIKGAINIPAYRDPNTPAYYDVERIVGEFAKLPDKEVIVYCYSTACMTGRKIGYLLARSGIYVKHLNIGWNEWRYDWKSWNHEHEWNSTSAEQYIEVKK